MRFALFGLLFLSLWGMNCEVPFQKDADMSFESVAPFLSICVTMLLVTIMMTVYFRKSDLL